MLTNINTWLQQLTTGVGQTGSIVVALMAYIACAALVTLGVIQLVRDKAFKKGAILIALGVIALVIGIMFTSGAFQNAANEIGTTSFL